MNRTWTVLFALLLFGVEAQQIHGQAGLPPPGSSLTAQTNYFVDSVAGSDANSGLSWDYPMASLTNSTIANVGGLNIWIKRGSVFRQQVYFPAGDIVRGYGTGAKPLISGGDILSNASFTQSAGWTHTWQIAMPAFSWPNTNPSPSIVNTNVLMIWENKNRLGQAFWESGISTLLQVDQTPGSFLLSNQVLYVHTSDSSDPADNGRLYEASTRTLAVWAGDNVWIEDLQAEEAYSMNGQGMQGYQFLADGGGTYRRCEGFRGWNHIMGTANAVVDSVPLVFDSCFAFDGENILPANGGMASFIGFKENFPTGMSNAVIFTNCLAGQPSLNADGDTTAFYSHAVPDTNVYTSIENCYFSNLDQGTLIAHKSIVQINGLYGTNMQIGLAVDSNGLSSVSISNFIFSGASIAGIWVQHVTNGVTAVSFNNGSNLNCAVGALVGQSTGIVAFTNVTFASLVNSGQGIESFGGSYNIYSYSNTFQNLSTYGAYDGDGVQCFLLGSDYNSFDDNGRVARLNPASEATLADWQSASGMGAHSICKVIDYQADFWNVAFLNPAVPRNAMIQTFDPDFGVSNNQFGFDITGPTNMPVVVEACANLASPVWTTLAKVTLTNGLYYFSEPLQTNSTGRYYRLKEP